MTTEDLRSQISQIIRSPSEMHSVIIMGNLISLIAVSLALLAMVEGVLAQSTQAIPVEIDVVAQKFSPTKSEVRQSASAGKDNPRPLPRYAVEFSTGGFILMCFIPLFAILAWRQDSANKKLRNRADYTASLIMDGWAKHTGTLHRIDIATIAEIRRVEVDDERIGRILSVLGTCAIDPLIWGQARGGLVQVP